MNTLEAKVLELIGESTDSPDVFTDDEEGLAPIRASLSEGIEEIAMLTGSYKRSYFLPLREDRAFYRLNPQNGSIGWITDVWSTVQQRRLLQTDLIRLSTHDPRWMITTGSPREYLPLGHDVVGIYPKPSGDGDMLELNYVEIPAPYTSEGARIKVRETFQYAVVEYAVADFWASRGDAAEAAVHVKAYMEALGLREQYRQFADDRPTLQTQKETG